jgi:hypothetical protein
MRKHTRRKEMIAISKINKITKQANEEIEIIKSHTKCVEIAYDGIDVIKGDFEELKAYFTIIIKTEIISNIDYIKTKTRLAVSDKTNIDNLYIGKAYMIID